MQCLLYKVKSHVTQRVKLKVKTLNHKPCYLLTRGCMQVTSAMRQAVRRAVSAAGPRLVEAMLLCEVAAAAEALAGAP